MTGAASPLWPRELILEFDAADQSAKELVTGLTAEQLNWQPRPGASNYDVNRIRFRNPFIPVIRFYRGKRV